jgi:site-specific DNA-cytosine methylase
MGCHRKRSRSAQGRQIVADCLDTHLGDKQWLEDQSVKKYETMRLVGAGVRRLTPTECERLQGFPDGWTAGQKDTARYRQLGNAVAVPVAEWIGKRIMLIGGGDAMG